MTKCYKNPDIKKGKNKTKCAYRLCRSFTKAIKASKKTWEEVEECEKGIWQEPKYKWGLYEDARYTCQHKYPKAERFWTIT